MRAATSSNNYTSEFFSWEHAFDPEYNHMNCCSSSVVNFTTKTTSFSVKSEPPMLSKIELFSNVLKLDDFCILNTLGRGSFGVVHEAILFNKKVALKVFHRNSDSNHKQQLLKSYIAEQNIRSLRHKNLITFLGCSHNETSDASPFIIYEFSGKLNLNQVILEGKVELTARRRRSFSLDLVNALEYIHANNIVHMDLKPANIIVTDLLVCKLTDFGCSLRIDSPHLTTTLNTTSQLNHNNNDNNNNNNSFSSINLNYNSNSSMIEKAPLVDEICVSNTGNTSKCTAGTWFYRAPELFRNDSSTSTTTHSNISTSCDIYSLGMCMWQLLTRDSPYRGENPHVVIYQIVSKGLRPEYPDMKYIQDLVYNNNNNSIMNNNHLVDTTSTVTVPSSTQLHSNSNDKTNNFEQLYRLIVEKSWDSDPNRRFTAKHIKELFTNNFVCK